LPVKSKHLIANNIKYIYNKNKKKLRLGENFDSAIFK